MPRHLKTSEPVMSAEEFHAARRLLDLTQTQMAGVLGVTRDCIAKYERRGGDCRPVPALTARIVREMLKGWRPSWYPTDKSAPLLRGGTLRPRQYA